MIRYLRAGALTLAVELRGTGRQTLLFAHGWISSRRMWYEVAGLLDPDRFTVHLLDFLGCVRRDVADAIRGALYVALRGAGHNLPVERPVDIAGIVARAVPA